MEDGEAGGSAEKTSLEMKNTRERELAGGRNDGVDDIRSQPAGDDEVDVENGKVPVLDVSVA